MRIGIIGAGFSGLAAGYYLSKGGHNVTIFDADKFPGGLAVGFKEKNWKWTVEKHYHHWFTNDTTALNLAKEIGQNVIVKRPKTCTYVNDKILQLDSPLNLLAFSEMPFVDRLRTGLVLAYLKYIASYESLEPFTAKKLLVNTMGKNSWRILWEPLFTKKFDRYASEISAAWFWARIKKRTPSLAYPEGGFLNFAECLSDQIKKFKGEINYFTAITQVEKKNKLFEVRTMKGKRYEFDRVVCTLSFSAFSKITKGLPKEYSENLLTFRGIGAIDLVLSLNQKFFKDETYWLNVNKTHFPFVAVVEHTNFMDKKYYNNDHLLYVGNYLADGHKYFKKDAFELLGEFYPFLKTINPKFDKSWIKKVYAFKDHFAQPIITTNYSRIVPGFATPIKGLYLCNMQQVYPWNRGTNYAVANGEAIAQLVVSE